MIFFGHFCHFFPLRMTWGGKKINPQPDLHVGPEDQSFVNNKLVGLCVWVSFDSRALLKVKNFEHFAV